MICTTSNDFQKEYWSKNKNKRSFSHPIVKYFATQRISYLKKYIDFGIINSAFDVGCGDGFATYYMSKEINNIAGGDISEVMLNNNPLNDGRLSIINAEILPLDDNSFDLVYCWELLHHLENPLNCIREMKRVAKKYVVIFEPNRANIFQLVYGIIKKEERGTIRSSKKYLLELCRDSGLEVYYHSFCGLIFPNMLPKYLFPLIKIIPFKLNRILGISNMIICKV